MYVQIGYFPKWTVCLACLEPSQGVAGQHDMRMDEPDAWGPSRYFTLIMVLLGHLAVLVAWILASRSSVIAEPSAKQPLTVIVYPVSPQPKRRLVEVRPQRLSGDLKEWLAPVTLQAPSLPPVSSAPDGGAGGYGAGPDWNAEARRAVQAYEIRSRLPPPGNLISGSPGDDRWWRRPHKVGDKYKTPTGDWVVWINTRCYQVATAATRSATNLQAPETVCPEDSKD